MSFLNNHTFDQGSWRPSHEIRYTHNVLEGLLDNHKVLYKFGESTLGNNTEEVVMKMTVPTNEPPQLALTSNQLLRVKAGGDVTDVAGGAGARTITLYGLDENYDEVSASLPLNGALASVSTPGGFIRCWRAFVSTAGANKTNTADIVIETTAGVEMCIIPAGLGQTQVAFWTSPASYNTVLHRIDVDVDSNKSAEVKIMMCNMAAAEPVKRVVTYLHGVQRDRTIQDAEWHYFYLPPKTDLWVTGQIPGAGAMSAIFQLEYYRFSSG